QGFPKPPEQTGQLPTPKSDPNSGVLIIDRVGDIDRAGDSIKASGPIEMDYRGYKIFADQMEGNLNSQVFVFNGHVQVIGAQGQV
ncbi:hypothetical protein ABTN24_19865, partial [Acinetobacter baumannii]